MRSKNKTIVLVAVIVAGLFLAHSPLTAADVSQKPKIAAPCKQCHKPDENVLRGLFTSVSNKANAIQMQIGPATWLVTYDDDTKLIGAEKWSKVPKEKEIAIAVKQKEGALYAVSVTLKPPVKVAPEKSITVEEVARLVAAGPDKGNFVIVDSRPPTRYSEEHIPGAISLPYAEFEKQTGKLPKEKDKLLIFYCAGPCQLSPASAAKAEKLGYTNVKIFVEGMQAWKNADNLVLSSASIIKEYVEKNIPFVLVDLRQTEDAKKGHIINAVSIPGKDIPTSKEKFPADKSAPIVLYDNDTKSAADDFVTVRKWGYANTAVLEGGFDEWKHSGGLVVSGEVATKITYVPKPRPGEIPVEEFKRIAETLPPDKLILDVRDEDEAMQGMLKGALNVPSGDIRDRLKDIPRDKEIVTHCATGVRAEMVYHMLREAGYTKVHFLNAKIKIDKDGKYVITKE